MTYLLYMHDYSQHVSAELFPRAWGQFRILSCLATHGAVRRLCAKSLDREYYDTKRIRLVTQQMRAILNAVVATVQVAESV